MKNDESMNKPSECQKCFNYFKLKTLHFDEEGDNDKLFCETCLDKIIDLRNKELLQEYNYILNNEEHEVYYNRQYTGKDVLLAISMTDPKPVKEIAISAECSHSSVRRHLKRFIKKGIVIELKTFSGHSAKYQLHSAILHQLQCVHQLEKDGHSCLVKQKFNGTVTTCYPYKSQWRYDKCSGFELRQS